MSSITWTPGALASEAHRLIGRGWRIVEAQHRISTLKLTDTLEEQALLETVLEHSKPPLPPECADLDYLLAAPFRYGAEYPKGSRFRRSGHTSGVFYCSRNSETAIAETSFHRLLFYAESPSVRPPQQAAEYTAFAAQLATESAIDLAQPPFDIDAAKWMSPDEYSACQELADIARQALVDVIAYASVRDPQHRQNLAVLHCRAFARPAPVARQTWHLAIATDRVRAICEMPSMRLEFPLEAFAADPRLAPLLGV